MKNNRQFFVGHICVGKFTFIKNGFEKKKIFFFIMENQFSDLF